MFHAHQITLINTPDGTAKLQARATTTKTTAIKKD
jgi:hypothetical protein